MELAVNGPDGATHLILSTGVADLRRRSNQMNENTNRLRIHPYVQIGEIVIEAGPTSTIIRG
jgi:hypothetical protein